MFVLFSVFRYKPDYSKATVAPFGHGAGCDFINEDCIVDGEVPDYSRGFFCNELWSSDAPRKCDATHTIRASCDLLNDEEPSGDFQWFEDEEWGGSFTKADHCPLNRYWTDPCDEDQRCFNVEGDDDDSVCLDFECRNHHQRVRFVVDGETFTCKEDFEIIETGTSIGNVVCPRFAAICPEAVCPGNCSGKGVCDWNSGTCICDDEDDDSDGCWGDDSASSPSTGSGGGGNQSEKTTSPTLKPTASPTALPTKKKDDNGEDKDKDKKKKGKNKNKKKKDK